MRSPASYYLQTRILCSPSETLFTLLIFILSKSLHATSFQLTLMACLKPITSLFSFYLSSMLHGRSGKIRSYLILNTLIGIAPCFLYPFIDNVWFYIASYAVYMITKRAQEPVWIEFLKRNLKFSAMSKTVSQGSSITYFISMFLPPLISLWLDDQIWKILFLSFAVLQLFNVITIFFLSFGPYEESDLPQKISLTHPLKRGWELLKRDPSFSHYLFLFFLGGAGIIAIHPILPKYFNDHLTLSYTQLTFGFSFCKGISFLLSSPLWTKIVSCISLYRLNAYMNLFTCLFIGGVLAASIDTAWLYVAYLCYGVMQSGCELTWNLSGPIFSKNGDSTPYSSLNLILVGIRGCICPFLGFLLFTYTSVISVFVVVSGICFLGILYGLWLDDKYSYLHGHAELHAPS